MGLSGRTSSNETDGAVRHRALTKVGRVDVVNFDGLYTALMSLKEDGVYEVFDVLIDTRDSTTLTAQAAGTDGSGDIGVSILSDATSTEWGADVAAALFAGLVGGVEVNTGGSPDTITHTDVKGNVHSYDLTPITENDIEMTITVTTNGDYPSNGDTLVAQAALPSSPQAIQTTVNSVAKGRFGYPVVVTEIACRVLEAVPGIETISVLVNVTGDPALESDIGIASNEIAAYDITDITVNS